MAPRHKSIETRHEEERASFFQGLERLATVSRRQFFRLAGASAGIAAAKGLLVPQSFQLVEVAQAAVGKPSFSFAYVSDTHMYVKSLNDRFVRQALKAVDDVNALDP